MSSNATKEVTTNVMNNRERRKSDTESINSDKQVADWIEDTQRARNTKPYRENNERKMQQADSLRSKSESSINTTGRPKSCPPPIAPKPSAMSSKEVILNRSANEGFGFVIMSSPISKGSVIGKFVFFSLNSYQSETSRDLKKVIVFFKICLLTIKCFLVIFDYHIILDSSKINQILIGNLFTASTVIFFSFFKSLAYLTLFL